MEVTFILNIRERNDCAKDKQSKYRVASTGQHQMVQKFVKELNDSTKQSEQPSNAERTATEQVETTAREIVHEAVQLPRRAIQHTARRESADSSANSQPEQSDQPHPAPESPRERTDAPRTQPDATPPQSAPTPAPQEQGRRAYVRQAKKSRAEKPSARDHLHTEQVEIRLADDMPQSAPPPIREKPDAPEIRSPAQSEAIPAKPSTVRHVKQPDTWTPRSATASAMRGRGQLIRERPAVTPAHDLPPRRRSRPGKPL